ncbi:MAG: DUF2062 domain-containing protein [Mangrovibacterium sp.]
MKNYLASPAPPQKTALALTLGFYLSIFPVAGSTTLLCLLATFLFRLNPLVIQTVNLLLSPVQLILMYPFLKAGRIILSNQQNLTPTFSPQPDPMKDTCINIKYLIELATGGIVVWSILFASTGYLLYLLILNFSQSLKKNKHLIT